MSDIIIDHDSWNHSIPKLPRASMIELPSIHGVLPFDGVRNPSARSSSSHKVFFTYKTAANDWKPKIGIGESAAEIAVAIEALLAPNIYDVEFQPLEVHFLDDDGKRRRYRHDVRITLLDGHRRLVFVRNEASLRKPKTTRQIKAIVEATPRNAANDMIVVNANAYTRQRRDNLLRMYQCVSEPDAEADEIVLEVARRLKTLWLMRDLFAPAPLSRSRVFQACHRLIARKQMHANMDQLLWEHSRIRVIA